MKTIKELAKEEEKFQKYVMEGYYTFIGPANQNLLEPFLKVANKTAPIVAFNRRLHDVLTHKPSVKTACQSLPVNTEFRIYVARKAEVPMLLHSTIEEYCEEHDIERNE